MRAVINLTENEIIEAILEYLENKSENISIAQHAALKIEFQYTAMSVDKLSGAQVIVEEKLVSED